MPRRSQTPSPVTPPGGVNRHGARIFDAERHDPYVTPGKYHEGTRCGTCGAVYREGRWQWPSQTESAPAASAACPACRRIEDRFPAGYLSLTGPYVAAHRDELERIAHKVAQQEGAEHPLNRIMGIDAKDGGIEITTTDVHLPRRIGEALKRAHDGELSITFARDACEIRVSWRR